MKRERLDKKLVLSGFADTRSQAENLIKLGYVLVDGQPVTKTGYFVSDSAKIEVSKKEKYVGRAGLKLESANKKFKVDFKGKVVLDAGSSTGGFSDYALQKGARKVIAVDVGTEQLHPKLRGNSKIELHEKTDIRKFKPKLKPDIILADLSFISLRKVLPHLAKMSDSKTQFIVMLKPQFEANPSQINRGVIKNDSLRREIFRDFELWTRQLFKIIAKSDSEVSGEKGNIERFYYLRKVKS